MSHQFDLAKGPTVAFATLGCKVNQYDTEAMIARFRERGYSIVDFDGEADVYVVNTCTVTGRGAAKSRQLIRQATRRNPEATVVVAGCYPQTDADEVMAIPGVSLALGTRDRDRVVDLVEEARRSPEPIKAVENIWQVREFEEDSILEFSGRTRAAVKIQEGCTQFCTYCIIPYARGPVRSRRPESVVEECRRLAEAGFKEIVLTGIHLGSYGRDLNQRVGRAGGNGEAQGPVTLASVVEMLLPIPGLERIRLSSLEPGHITDRLIELMASEPKVCRHFHLSLQSGSDDVLRRMRRGYTAGDYLATVERIRREIPEIGLSTDIMVGFPGETEENFRETIELAREAAFSRIHIFQFSRRKGTPAADYPDQVPNRVKEERAHRLAELGSELSLAFHKQFLGREVEVLVEEESGQEGVLEGLTDNYIRVRFPGPAERKNTLSMVRIAGVDSEGAVGEETRPSPGNTIEMFERGQVNG